MLILTGVIIGFVMGLTGAGGALVSIPLFMQFQNMTLKEASVYSLIAVIVASFSNFYYQRKEAETSLAATLIIASAIGSFASRPYKILITDLYLALILSVVALYSLYSVWKPSPPIASTEQAKIHPALTALIGLFLGVLTTFTGLGGGVLMLPILIKVYRFKQEKAVATSLVVIGASSLASFIIQVAKETEIQVGMNFFGLFAGVLVTSYLLKKAMNKLPLKVTNKLREVIFTIVVGLSLIKIF